MENKDTNTDYQEVVRAGDQMREMEEIASGTIFLVEIHNYYFLHIQEIFLKKIIPIQSASSYSKSEFDLSSYYINLLKNGSPLSPPASSPPIITQGDANYEIPLDRSVFIFDCNKTVEAIIMNYL